MILHYFSCYLNTWRTCDPLIGCACSFSVYTISPSKMKALNTNKNRPPVAPKMHTNQLSWAQWGILSRYLSLSIVHDRSSVYLCLSRYEVWFLKRYHRCMLPLCSRLFCIIPGCARATSRRLHAGDAPRRLRGDWKNSRDEHFQATFAGEVPNTICTVVADNSTLEFLSRTYETIVSHAHSMNIYKAYE